MSPISRHSLQPVPLGVTFRISERCVQVVALTRNSSRPKLQATLIEFGAIQEDAKTVGSSVPLIFQIFLDFERGHATGACGGDCLPVAPILYIAAGKHAWY